jgi:hypothetical protein
MAYGYLSPQEQWQLHDFFQPSHDLSEEQLLAHRVRITAERPALPAQAGRALAKIDQIAAELAVHQVRAKKRAALQMAGGKRTNQRSKDRRIRVLGVVRPEIDTERFARAIIKMAEELAAKEAEKTTDPDEGATAA